MADQIEQQPHEGNDADSPQGSRRNPADNLSLGDRRRGGVRSAKQQKRDKRGQFSGRKPVAGGDGEGGGETGSMNKGGDDRPVSGRSAGQDEMG